MQTEESKEIRAEIRKSLFDNLVQKGCIADDADFYEDLGGDSLDLVNVGNDLENRFHIEISSAELKACRTVLDFEALIRKKTEN